jgi:ribonucleoside-diphosphate reductase alpha chain
MYKVTSSLMTGGGIGVDYSALRPEGAPIKGTGGFSTGPIALMKMVNEAGRHIMQGGQRRSAIYASLNWKHDDVYKFMSIKNHNADFTCHERKRF